MWPSDGKIQAKGDSSKSLTWKQACSKLGVKTIQVTGKNPGPCALGSSGVGGVEMADVSVDTETGIVKINKMVCAQDCGLIIDLKTAESQCYGALIMGITYALFEQKIMDDATGRMLNPNMEFYKLAGIGDIGELVVHMMTGPGYDERGVIGLGEPPVISPGAAISNAVANAIGVRVPTLPITPEKVLAALEKGGTILMQTFEYVSPTTLQAAVHLLAEAKGEAAVLAGGTDLLSLMKDRVAKPARVVDLQKVKELKRIEFQTGSGLRLGALVTFDELIENAEVRQHYPALVQAAEGVTSPQIRSMGTVGGDLCQRPRCWYYRLGYGLLGDLSGKTHGARRRQPLPRHPGQFRSRLFREPFKLRRRRSLPWEQRFGCTVPRERGNLKSRSSSLLPPARVKASTRSSRTKSSRRSSCHLPTE